ncbi:MAG: phosphatase PAP2 family protein [Armatimonadota bacterium]|nr:phosphatase PAP2 family protein [Armatimonadota bacterium]
MKGRRRMPGAPAWFFLGGCAAVAGATFLPVVRQFDSVVGRAWYRSGSPTLTEAMEVLAQVGGRDRLVWWVPLVLGALYLGGGRRWLPFFVVAMLGSPLLETAAKALVRRPRPAVGGGVRLDSFPSGHVLAATVLAGALAIILLPVCRRWWQRALLWSIAVAWVLAIGACRVYLGRHHLTDVLGSVLLGAAWLHCCHGWLAPRATSPESVQEAVGLSPKGRVRR